MYMALNSGIWEERGRTAWFFGWCGLVGWLACFFLDARSLSILTVS